MFARRSPRALALWAAAALVAIVTALVVASDLATIHRRAGDLGPVVDAVAARRTLPLGSTVSDRDVRTRPVHRGELPTGAIEGTARVVGRVVAVPVPRGGFVSRAHLAGRERTGLDGAIPRGMRALRVVATDAVRPRPGAAVDVLATLTTSSDERSQTVVVASGVLVIGIDERTVDGSATGTSGDTLGVTLLVASDVAPRIAFAQANGVVTIALVPPEEAARR